MNSQTPCYSPRLGSLLQNNNGCIIINKVLGGLNHNGLFSLTITNLLQNAKLYLQHKWYDYYDAVVSRKQLQIPFTEEKACL